MLKKVTKKQPQLVTIVKKLLLTVEKSEEIKNYLNMENTNSVNDSENSASTVFGTDRSWNDPQALFDYKVSSSTTTGTKLNKRIGFPSSTPPSSNVSSMRPESSKLNDAGAKSTTEGKNSGSLVLVMA